MPLLFIFLILFLIESNKQYTGKYPSPQSVQPSRVELHPIAFTVCRFNIKRGMPDLCAGYQDYSCRRDCPRRVQHTHTCTPRNHCSPSYSILTKCKVDPECAPLEPQLWSQKDTISIEQKVATHRWMVHSGSLLQPARSR